MSNKNKPQEFREIDVIINTSYNGIYKLLPITNSRQYKSNIKKSIKKIMDYDLEINKSSIINLLKIINNKNNFYKNLISIIKIDLRDVKQEYHNINHTYSEYIGQMIKENIKLGYSIDNAIENLQENNEHHNHLYSLVELYRNSEIILMSKYCATIREMKKHELMLRLLKKIKYHLQFLLSKYC